jgi:Xaa-Pro aminopeptidase
VRGYCSDVTRTFVVGAAADPRQREMYDVVRRAQLRARTGLRAGLTGKEADALARDVIEREGHGNLFGHSLGHGIGLEAHEAPRLSRMNESRLPVGAVVTVEPGVYLQGWGGIRIEDDVLLGPESAECLSDGRTDLVELT